MRFSGLALLASATLVGACGGGENKPKDTTANAACPGSGSGRDACPGGRRTGENSCHRRDD